MKKILMTLALLVSSISYAESSLSNVSLTALAKANKAVYIRINQMIPTPAQYDSWTWEKNKGGLFSSDKYTLRLTFRFKRKGAYGAKDGSGSQLLPIKQGTLTQISEVRVNPSQYQSSDAFYLSAEGQAVQLSDDQSTRESVYLQILGNHAGNISKLTVGDLENIFENAITIYTN